VDLLILADQALLMRGKLLILVHHLGQQALCQAARVKVVVASFMQPVAVYPQLAS